ncbi:type II toxin-antitoxin system HicA family toxin [Candidatus Peregrinibacteria bacterium]|nr:type II toxin-antitoxin system HicA family toxin [Candidatus Peregrinibacteria bacterium]
MPKLPRYTARQLTSLLEKKGFLLVRQSGSHRIYRNEQGVRATVPFHGSKTIHPKIVKQILKDIG